MTYAERCRAYAEAREKEINDKWERRIREYDERREKDRAETERVCAETLEWCRQRKQGERS